MRTLGQMVNSRSKERNGKEKKKKKKKDTWMASRESTQSEEGAKAGRKQTVPKRQGLLRHWAVARVKNLSQGRSHRAHVQNEARPKNTWSPQNPEAWVVSWQPKEEALSNEAKSPKPGHPCRPAGYILRIQNSSRQKEEKETRSAAMGLERAIASPVAVARTQSQDQPLPASGLASLGSQTDELRPRRESSSSSITQHQQQLHRPLCQNVRSRKRNRPLLAQCVKCAGRSRLSPFCVSLPFYFCAFHVCLSVEFFFFLSPAPRGASP